MALKQLLIILTVSSLALCQRPFFAGSRPIGYPELTTTTVKDELGNRFGENDKVPQVTQRLPIEANGDRDLVDRLSKLPTDQQPFWLINWQALEANRNKPQTYPLRPNQFAQPFVSIDSEENNAENIQKKHANVDDEDDETRITTEFYTNNFNNAHVPVVKHTHLASESTLFKVLNGPNDYDESKPSSVSTEESDDIFEERSSTENTFENFKRKHPMTMIEKVVDPHVNIYAGRSQADFTLKNVPEHHATHLLFHNIPVPHKVRRHDDYYEDANPKMIELDTTFY